MSFSSLSSLSDGEDAAPSVSRLNPPKLDAFNKYDDVDFRIRFRLSKETVIFLSGLIENQIKPVTRRNRALQAIDQVLITLRYFATGSFQKVVGDLFHVQQPTIHRIVHKVAAAIASLGHLYINMPGDAGEQAEIANEFYSIAGFPRVLGAVDCTHIKINSPGGSNAEQFRNRKGYFSLNVQMVCDPLLKIRNIIARWPGSVHDSTIFNDSPLCAEFERGDFGYYFLLGDSGYPCRPYLLTPLTNPSTPAQERYNQAQISTRNPVERLYGVLKRRFPCLRIGLGVDIRRVPTIIVACAVLHNIAIMRNEAEEVIEPSSNNSFSEDLSEEQTTQHSNEGGNAVRNSIIETYFT